MGMESKIYDIKQALRAAFKYTIPVLTGFMVLGIAYGVLMHTKGYGVIWGVLMSAIAFGGSMQFAAITLLTTAFDPVQAFLLSLMVNARHLFYGLSMLDKYKGLGKARYILIFMLCDETFSIENSIEVPKGINRKYFYLSISILDYLYWVSATFIGEVFGGFIKFDTTGLDFALTALFVVLFIEQIRHRENRIPGLIGIICTVVCLALCGASGMVIASMVCILMVLLIGRRWIWS